MAVSSNFVLDALGSIIFTIATVLDHIMASKLSRVLFTSGSLVVIGLVFILYLPSLLPAMIDYGLSIRPDSFAYNLWIRNPMPLTLEFFFHNWTNPEHVHNKSVKPHFKEIGPFVFNEVREKTNLVWNDNETVSYHQRHTWVFDKEKSVSGLDTLITSVNPTVASAVFVARHWSYLMKKGVQYSIRALSPKLHVSKRAGDILFSGYDDPFVTISYHIPMNLGAPKIDKFAWFYDRNHTDHFDGLFNMRTNARSIGQIASWNGFDSTPFYDGDCAKVRGSAGEIYGPNLKPESVSFFQTDCCRNMKLDFIRIENIDGVLGYRYEASDSMLDNGDKVPENACYNIGDCVPYGLMNISRCRYGTPTFVSLPHFFKVDPIYLDTVDGLAPNPEKHSLYMTLEPTTGVPLYGFIRLQINLLLRPVKHITTFDDVPSIYMPVLWFQQTAKLPNYLLIGLKIFLSLNTIFHVLGYIILLTGLITGIITIAATYLKKFQSQRSLNVELRQQSKMKMYYSAKGITIQDPEKNLLPLNI